MKQRFASVYRIQKSNLTLVRAVAFLICPEMKSAFQSLLERWCGTEELVYALMDYPEAVEEIAGLKIDVLESVTPFPTGNVEMARVDKVLPKRIFIIGGIEPVKLLNCSSEEIAAQGRELIHIMRRRGYILANSDSCPPGVKIQQLYKLIPGSKGRKSDASLLAGGFLNLGPAKNMKKQPDQGGF